MDSWQEHLQGWKFYLGYNKNDINFTPNHQHHQYHDYKTFNFNGCFVLMEWDRESTKKKGKKIHKCYKLVYMLVSEIIISSPSKTWLSAWWRNPYWKGHRQDVSCSWSPGLQTSQEGFWPTPLYRSSLSSVYWLLPDNSFVAVLVCFGPLSWWKTHPWLMFSPLAEGRRFSLMHMAPQCFFFVL